MASLNYLTVQDILWINLQVTKRVNRFDYAKLEDASFGQYAVGGPEGVVPQAARLLSTFLRMRPIAAGNEATAFVAALAFLRANGFEVKLDDAKGAEWLSRAMANPASEEALISEIAIQGHAGHGPGVHGSIEEVLEAFPKTLESLHPKAAASA